jgi:hypothetical protein
MLGHGSSIFGIIPLAAVAAWRGFPSGRWVATGVLTGVVLLLPWSMYQKYGDPPGNRLTKWMLAGDIGPDSRPALSTIIDAYRTAGAGGAVHFKAENFVTLTGGGPMANLGKDAVDSAESGDVEAALLDIRSIVFFYLLPSFGLLLVAPALMLAARIRRTMNGPEWKFALMCYLVLTIGAITWCLLLFGNSISRTVVHQGSYVLPILGFCGAAAGLRATFPRFATWFLAFSGLLSLAIYAPSFDPPPNSSYFPLAITFATLGLLAFGLVALRGVGEADRTRRVELAEALTAPRR